MRLLFLLAVLSVAAVPPAVGQTPRDSARVPAVQGVPFHRVPGERFTLRVVRSQAEREGGVLMDSTRSVWLVDERVLARRPRSYTFAWT